MEEDIVLCDSNVFINWFKNDATTLEALEKIGLDKILISSVTVMELVRGCNDKNELRKLKQRIKHYSTLHYNEKVSTLAERFMYNYRLSNDLKIPDAIIGASAVVFKIPLFTHNVKDFKFMPGIVLYKNVQ